MENINKIAEEILETRAKIIQAYECLERMLKVFKASEVDMDLLVWQVGIMPAYNDNINQLRCYVAFEVDGILKNIEKLLNDQKFKMNVNYIFLQAIRQVEEIIDEDIIDKLKSIIDGFELEGFRFESAEDGFIMKIDPDYVAKLANIEKIE